MMESLAREPRFCLWTCVVEGGQQEIFYLGLYLAHTELHHTKQFHCKIWNVYHTPSFLLPLLPHK